MMIIRHNNTYDYIKYMVWLLIMYMTVFWPFKVSYIKANDTKIHVSKDFKVDI